MINKFTLIILLILAHIFSLSGQDNTQNPTKKTSQIKITPLHISELDDFKQIPTTPEAVQQTSSSQAAPAQKPKPKPKPLILPTQWILESSMNNAPELLKGIFLYLQSCSRYADESQHTMTIPSFHRFILVGPPGSGKTTLAHAIGHMLGYHIVFAPATGFLGHFRNETAVNIQKFLIKHSSDGLKKVIIIDELHKLFEHHNNSHTDHSQTAAAFWLALDDLEKRSPNIIFIGTANNVAKLPPEIKSRFSGKVITMPIPNKNQKIQAFKDSITHDSAVTLDSSVNDAFIAKMIQQIQSSSLRDVQLIIDTAKMFYYAENTSRQNMLPILLTRSHFQQALNQLQVESQVLQENFSDKFCKKLQPWGVVFAIAANICTLTRAPFDLYKIIPDAVKKNISTTMNNLFNNDAISGML